MLKDKRLRPRMELELQCFVRANSGKPLSLVGVTANISRSGVLVRCAMVNGSSWCPEVGEVVRVDVALPPVNGRGQRCFHGVAEVRRIESNATEAHIGLEFQSLRFRKWRRLYAVAEVRGLKALQC